MFKNKNRESVMAKKIQIIPRSKTRLKLVGKLQSAITESYKGFDISWSLLNDYIPTKILKECLKEAKESKDE